MPTTPLATIVASALLLASIAQLTNYNYLYAGTGSFIKEFVIWDHPVPWILTLVPFLLVACLLVKYQFWKVKPTMITSGFMLVLMLVLFKLTPSKAHYYFYSGCVGYVCFMMIRRISCIERPVATVDSVEQGLA